MMKPLPCYSFVFLILLYGAVFSQSTITLTNNRDNFQQQQLKSSFQPGAVLYDDKSDMINAHGGGIIFANNKYF